MENLKSALRQLEQKLTEAQAKADLLIAQHRRARAVGKASNARLAMGDGSKAAAFDRMKHKVAHSEAGDRRRRKLPATIWKIAWPRWKKRIASSSCWRS